MNLWAIFLTGLTTGGLSCLAMQGGLLASVIANQKRDETKHQQKNLEASSFDQLDWMPVTLFLLVKIIIHTIFGFFLGWLGSKIELSLTARLIFQGVAALFMLATAGNLLNLHPIFRYLVFTPPKFFQRLIRNTTKSKALFTPALLGLMTIFIPCGVTQAMEVLAISSGSPVQGALIMFFFVLGTSPIFALVGVATAKLSETFKRYFLKIASTLLIFLALSSINGILVVLDSPITFGKIVEPLTQSASKELESKKDDSVVETVQGTQQVLINVLAHGYSPNLVQVKVGIPVQLTLQTKETYSCANSFVFKAFNIKLQLGPTDSQTVFFTPTKKGKYTFSCSMGMYTGTMEVI